MGSLRALRAVPDLLRQIDTTGFHWQIDYPEQGVV
jgi:hypothetical protein